MKKDFQLSLGMIAPDAVMIRRHQVPHSAACLNPGLNFDFAHAMLRERIHCATSNDGSSAMTWSMLRGHTPKRSRNLWAVHPSLKPFCRA